MAEVSSPPRPRPLRPGPEWEPLDRALDYFKLDFDPRFEPPPNARFVLALVLAVVLSLISDAILVFIGTHVFPATVGFPHFEFSDYGKLTVIGVVIACLAWPITARISSCPRWVFLRMAVVVTLFLWLPDLWILVNGELPEGVLVLMCMHLAIALITYNTLVRVAPIGPPIRRISHF